MLKSSDLLPHQAEDLAHVKHFICKLHNQKLQHYVLVQSPTSVQSTITLAQKEDAEFYIIEGLHNHDPEHEISHISNKEYQGKSSIPGPCHGCSGLHLIRDCEDSVCKRCKLNLDNHAPARCPIRKSLTKQQCLTDTT